MSLLEETLAGVEPVEKSLEALVWARLDNLTKPKGSLGRLEEMALRYCLASGTARPEAIKKRIVCFAADHGVTEEGVSAFPREVTVQMVDNMLAGGAAVNVLSRHAGADLKIVDIGVAAPLSGRPGLVTRKVKPGTSNMAQGPAMSLDEAKSAVEAGISLAREAAAQGVNLLGTGEMGIGNTTPSSAVFAALLPCGVDEIAGRGTGIDDAALARKKEVIALSLCVNKALLTDPLSTLAAVGGLEIAGICGLILGGAASKIPVVVDGFISTAGALAAQRLNPAVSGYLFFSHMSAEAGHAAYFRQMGISPILDLKMRLGEGTGAALAMLMVEAGVKILNEMATFDSAGVARNGG